MICTSINWYALLCPYRQVISVLTSRTLLIKNRSSIRCFWWVRSTNVLLLYVAFGKFLRSSPPYDQWSFDAQHCLLMAFLPAYIVLTALTHNATSCLLTHNATFLLNLSIMRDCAWNSFSAWLIWCNFKVIFSSLIYLLCYRYVATDIWLYTISRSCNVLSPCVRECLYILVDCFNCETIDARIRKFFWIYLL